MGMFEVTAPDGTRYRVEGDSMEGAVAAISKMLGNQPATPSVSDRIAAARVTPEAQARAAAADRKTGMPSMIDAQAAIDARKPKDEFIQRVVESATLGLVGDEARAALRSIGPAETYDQALAAERSEEQQFREEYPGGAFMADMAGLAVPGGGAAKVLNATTRTGKAAAGAATGAVAGGVYGAAEGEGAQDRFSDAGWGALFGAGLGASGTVAAEVLKKIPRAVSATFKRSLERPTTSSLKAAKNAAYKAVDESGEVFGPDDMQGLFQRVSEEFSANNYVEEVDSASRAVLKILENRQGQPTTISQLDGIRQNLWKRYASAKDQPQILGAIKAIDDLIESRAGTSELMGVARSANARYAKSQLLEDAFQKAEDQTASTGSGGNILNKYRQAVTSIINNPNKSRFFSQDEVDMMRGFVNGSISENTLRKIGKLSPDGNGLMLALHTIGGVASSGATVPLMALGAGAKRAADKKAFRGKEAIMDNLSGFQRPSPEPVPFNALLGTGATATAPLAGELSNAFQYTRSQPRRDMRQR